MTERSRLEQAASLLMAAYEPGSAPSCAVSVPKAGTDSTWIRFLRVLLGLSQGHPAEEKLNELLETSALASPRLTVDATTGQLVELLAPIPGGSKKAAVVRALATWWLGQFGEEASPPWTLGVEASREALRKIRGLGPATVDELLLFAAHLAVFPVDRSALRIAVRHGWLDLPIEDADAQSFFVRGLANAELDPRTFSRWLSRVGEQHCGRILTCDGCPLQPMLPATGPINPESC